MYIVYMYVLFRRTQDSDIYMHAYIQEKIRRMCDANKQSLEVSYMHLSQAQPVFGIWIADAPAALLDVLNESAMDVVLQVCVCIYVYTHIHVPSCVCIYVVF
jgi:hypothetical protein